MRRRLAALLVAALVALPLGACTAAAPTTDPYPIAARAFSTGWDRVQVSVGLRVSGPGETVDIPPSAMVLIIDGAAGKGLVRVSIPASALGQGGSIPVMGMALDSFDLDAVFDRQGFYVRSRLLGLALKQVFGRTRDLPPGDLTGWMRLFSKADLEALARMSGSEPAPSALPGLVAEPLREELESVGFGLAYIGQEQRNGQDADHLRATVDLDRMANSPAAGAMTPLQLSQLRQLAGAMTVSADFWADRANGRLVELDLHMAVSGSGGGSVEMPMLFAAPPADTTIEEPSTYLDVPFLELISPFLSPPRPTS